MLSFQHVINMKINDINQCENWNPECVLYYMPACSVAQSCPTLCDPMDCSPLDSFVLGIFQARILQWVAISFSWGSSRPKNWNCISCIGSTSQFGLVMFHVLSSVATGYCIGQHTSRETLRKHLFVGGAWVGKERERRAILVLHWQPLAPCS